MLTIADAPTTLTVANIAARVRLPAALQIALKTYEGLREELRIATDELRRKVLSHREDGPSRSDVSERALAAQQAELDRLKARTTQARDAANEARPAYGRAVASALAPLAAQAAQNARAAANGLREAIGVLEQVQQATARASGDLDALGTRPIVFPYDEVMALARRHGGDR